MSTVYKITLDRSSVFVAGAWTVHYDLLRWSRPSVDGTTLLAFDDLYYARIFAENMRVRGAELWVCEAQGVRSPPVLTHCGTWYMDCLWSRVTGRPITSFPPAFQSGYFGAGDNGHERPWPIGTVFCDAVMPLRLIS